VVTANTEEFASRTSKIGPGSPVAERISQSIHDDDRLPSRVLIGLGGDQSIDFSYFATGASTSVVIGSTEPARTRIS
jgi:hypothetical protein